MEGDPDIKDAVDIASEEIVDEKVYVKINGKYTVEPDEKKLEELRESLIKEEIKE